MKPYSNLPGLLKNMHMVVSFALPISISAIISMLSSFIAMLFVAQLGDLELAAGALAVTTFTAIATVVMTMLYAIGILIGHTRGQGGSPLEIGVLVKNGFWLALALAIPAMICLFNIDTLLVLFNQDKALVDIAKDYFYFAAISLFPTLVFIVISQFYAGIGNPRFSMFISLITLPLTIFLSYSFILGKFNFPQLGLSGIACATLITNCLICIGTLLYIVISKNTRHYKILSGRFWPNLNICRRIFTLGAPIGIQFGGELSAMAIATYFMGYFGVPALVATQIVSQCSILVVMISLGFSQAMSILVSEANSKNDFPLIRQYIASGILILILFFMLVFMCFFLKPEILINLYLKIDDQNNQEIVRLAINLFIISGVILLFDAVRNLLAGGLRGLQDSKAPMIIGLVCLWCISLPLCYWVAFTFGGGPVGLRIGFSVGFIMAAAILWFRIQQKISSITNFELLPQQRINSV